MDLNANATANPAAKLLASPLAFLQPTAQLNGAFLAAAKQFLDPVAAGVSEEQAQRQQELRKKRKRGEGYDGDIRVLHLKKVHLQGFGVNQVFEQARKIVDAATEEIELALPGDKDEDDTLAIGADEDDEDSELSGAELEEDEHSSDIGEEGVDWQYDGEDVSGEEGLSGEDDEDEDALDGEDVDMEDGEEGIFSDDGSELDEPAETYHPDPNGLNDGFFEIDQFNKQTDFLVSLPHILMQKR
jgi:U3 small nucleolar RNA-associated protein MPP10